MQERFTSLHSACNLIFRSHALLVSIITDFRSLPSVLKCFASAHSPLKFFDLPHSPQRVSNTRGTNQNQTPCIPILIHVQQALYPHCTHKGVIGYPQLRKRGSRSGMRHLIELIASLPPTKPTSPLGSGTPAPMC